MDTVKRMRTFLPRTQVLIVTSPAISKKSTPPRIDFLIDFLKACVDYPLSLAILIASTPIILFAMLLIRLTSSGPAIYHQTRLGRSGRPFTIYKLRTMCDDAEGLTGPRWSLPGDPRITPIGHLLRNLHIDELPQLWNVLRGEMSLVGPRPERPEIVAGLRKLIRGYDSRLSVKPGITGFAQIHLPPDESIASVRRKLIYDQFYIRKQSLFFDLYIIACTACKVFGLRRLYRRA